MSSNAEKLYKLIANDSKKKQSLFMTALTNLFFGLSIIDLLGESIFLEFFMGQ